MRRKSIAIVMILATLSFAAGDEPIDAPTTPAAKGALAKLEQAKEKARVEYERAIKKAEDEAKGALEKVKADAMKRGDLEEANRIQAVIDSLGEQAAQRERLTVSAGKGWHDTVQVTAGQTLKIRAAGKWCADPTRRREYTFGPEITTKSGLQFGLYGRFNDGPLFEVGRGTTVKAPTDGVLQLKLGGGHEEKSDDGAVQVEIAISD